MVVINKSEMASRHSKTKYIWGEIIIQGASQNLENFVSGLLRLISTLCNQTIFSNVILGKLSSYRFKESKHRMVFHITERKKFFLIEVTFDFKLSADVFVFFV